MLEAIVDEEIHQQQIEPKRRVFASSLLRESLALLTPRAPISVAPDEPVGSARGRMLEHRVGCVLVSEPDGLVGILTERDLLRNAGSIDTERTPVSMLMTPRPTTVPETASIAAALALMRRGGFRHLPVVDDSGRPVGVVSVRDIVDLLADFFSREVLTIPPRPGLDLPTEREGA